MTTANWITIIMAILAAAVTWGRTTTQLSGLREELRELRSEFNRSREDQGKRLEAHSKELTRLETRNEVAQEYSRGHHDTRGVPR